jgi:hypothetical protein
MATSALGAVASIPGKTLDEHRLSVCFMDPDHRDLPGFSTEGRAAPPSSGEAFQRLILWLTHIDKRYMTC